MYVIGIQGPFNILYQASGELHPRSPETVALRIRKYTHKYYWTERSGDTETLFSKSFGIENFFGILMKYPSQSAKRQLLHMLELTLFTTKNCFVYCTRYYVLWFKRAYTKIIILFIKIYTFFHEVNDNFSNTH